MGKDRASAEQKAHLHGRYTTLEAAELIGVEPATLRRWMKDGSYDWLEITPTGFFHIDADKFDKWRLRADKRRAA